MKYNSSNLVAGLILVVVVLFILGLVLSSIQKINESRVDYPQASVATSEVIKKVKSTRYMVDATDNFRIDAWETNAGTCFVLMVRRSDVYQMSCVSGTLR